MCAKDITYKEADLAGVVQLPDMVLELEERGQVVLLAHRARKLGARFRDGALLHRTEADVTDEAAIVQEDVLAEVTVEDLGAVVGVQVADQLFVVVAVGEVAVAAAVIDGVHGVRVPEDELLLAGA